MKNRVAVALSGGIDSTVSAYLLKSFGFSIIGIHFVTGFEESSSAKNINSRLKNLSKILDIPIKTVNIKQEFKSNIVDYFVKTYCEGRTPNPCIKCNEKIKFSLLMNLAKNMGANKIATGHYARIEKCSDGTFLLKKGIDKTKDQSYFVSRLKQKQLIKIIFPLGNMTKLQVKKIALRNNLSSLDIKESQDICFIRSRNYSNFINIFLKEKPKLGDIIDTDGKYLGTHKGLHHFTIGQRRGINCSSSKPYYVVKIDIKRNCLVVGQKRLLYTSKCIVKNINWILINPEENIRINTKIRYGQPSFMATLIPIDDTSAEIEFDIPQLAIAPGQIAVFYNKNKVIGSGWMEVYEEKLKENN